MAAWWYTTAGQRTGPVGDDAIRAMALSGVLSPQSPVYRDGQQAWTELAAFEAELGLPRNGWGTYFVTPITNREPEPGGELTALASAGSRFQAAVIDYFVMATLTFILLLLAMPLLRGMSPTTVKITTWIGYAVLYMLYEVVCIAVRGQTAGKLRLNLEVVVADTAELPDLSRAVLRTLTKGLIGLLWPIWCISVIVALVTPRRTSLHDLMAGTVVQRTPY